MNTFADHQLANLRRKEIKLRPLHQEILACDGEKALEKILDAPSPATLVQSFPDQDLYYLMHKIGPYDFIPVLSMASSEQWEYILDIELWDGDRLEVNTMTKVLDLLFQADPERILRWGIKEKPGLFEYYLSKHVTVRIREHDELPPSDFDDYITIDDKFYFRFPEKPKLADDQMPVPGNTQPAWELIEQMLKMVAGMDLYVFHGVLMETDSLLPAEVEEEEFRLKTLRLAEKGFMPTHEAIGIYQPAGIDNLRPRPQKKTGHAVLDPDIPMPPQFFSVSPDTDDLFLSALSYLDSDLLIELESEMAALINKIISADKIKIRSRQDIEKATLKTRSYINMGLEIILEKNLRPEKAHSVISTFFLEDIFRTASSACIRLKMKVSAWFPGSFMNTNNLPLSFLGEYFLGVLGGLMVERPLCFDPAAGNDLLREFKTLKDIEQTQMFLDQIIALDTIMGKINPDITTFTQGILTYKTLILTLWAKDRLSLTPDLEPIDIEIFKPFFSQFFSTAGSGSESIRKNDLGFWICEATGFDESEIPEPFLNVIEALILELEDEYSTVSENDLDPRFISHFLLKNNKGV